MVYLTFYRFLGRETCYCVQETSLGRQERELEGKDPVVCTSRMSRSCRASILRVASQDVARRSHHINRKEKSFSVGDCTTFPTRNRYAIILATSCDVHFTDLNLHK